MRWGKKMDNGVFVTGTDTEIGKTVITTGLISALQDEGYDIGGMKPFQSGAYREEGELLAPDVEFMLQYTNLDDDYNLLNPVRLEPALAPSLAAEVEEEEISVYEVESAYQELQQQYQGLVVEGAGGLMVPLAEDFLIPDLIKLLDLPVIIVARPNLGTINHSVLTVKTARNLGLDVLGVVINNYPQQEAGIVEESNPALISKLADVPILGVVPHLPQLENEANNVDLGLVIKEHLDLEKVIEAMSI